MYFRVDFMVCLNILRLMRLIHYLSMHQKMEFLKELVQLVNQSKLVIFAIMGIMIACSLFLSMFLNNSIVVSCLLGQSVLHDKMQVYYEGGKVQD
jgi:hypothetical protein